MSASDLPQENLDKAEERPIRQKQPRQPRRWLGIFQRSSQPLPAENETSDNQDGQGDSFPAAVDRDNGLPETNPYQPEEQTAVFDPETEASANNFLNHFGYSNSSSASPIAAADAQKRVAVAESMLEAQTNRADALSAELAALHGQLNERDAALQAQLNIGAEQRAALEALRATNESLETELHMAQAKIEQMALDQQNLEAALTASIQHAAEQEDSLVRWQELAESADECVTGLEKQITFLQQALHECNDQREGLHQEYEETSQALAQAQAQLESLNHHQETVVQLAQAQQRIDELEETLEEDTEKLTWYKLSLANSRTALVRAGLQLGEQEKALQSARNELSSREQTIDRSRATFARLAAGLQLKHESEKNLREKLSKLNRQIHEERALWYKTLKRNEQQLAATEAELNHFWPGYRAQGQRLADIQAALLDREQALAESRTHLQQQTQLLRYLRHAADERITQLESTLAQAEQQIRDLQKVVERRTKRGIVDGEP